MTQSTQQTQSSSQPGFAPQVSDLTTAFNDANGALGQAQGATAPTNFTAQFTPDQLSTFGSMLNFSNGTSTAPQTAAGNTNISSGTGATTGALTGLEGFNPSATNNTSSLINSANQFVQGQNIPAEVQQAMLPSEQAANQVTLPGITQNADATGNADSSRTGLAQGMVEQGLAENAQNLDGSLTSNAFSNGLNLAENQAQSNNNNTLAALTNQGQLGNTTTNTGDSLASNAINNQGALFNIGEAAGSGEQAANQANLTNQEQQFQAQTSDPFAALDNYFGIVGSQNFGTNTTGTQTTTPSALSVIGGLLGGAGSLAGGLGSLLNPKNGSGSST